MSRNGLDILVAVLAVAVLVVGCMLYQQRRKGVQIESSGDGVRIEGN